MHNSNKIRDAVIFPKRANANSYDDHQVTSHLMTPVQCKCKDELLLTIMWCSGQIDPFYIFTLSTQDVLNLELKQKIIFLRYTCHNTCTH